MKRCANRRRGNGVTMLIFRADGNAELGSGHVMRCLSIADAARRLGEDCLFVTASGDFEGVIAARGHKNYILHTDYRNMGSEDFLPFLRPYPLTALFVDSYFVSEPYLSHLAGHCRNVGAKLIYVDDLAAFPYPCDLLLNYNIYARAADYGRLYAGRQMPGLLLGTAYAPLREEFANLAARAVREEASDIFISTGGADSEHMAVELLQAAGQWPYTFHVVIGSLNRDRELLHKLSEGCGNIVLHENVTSMSSLMRSCDVAISAAGSTLYELCAAQTPTVTYVLADNQKPGAAGFSAHGIMENAGDVRELGNRKLAEKLVCSAASLAKDANARRRIIRAMQDVTDGCGAERLLQDLLISSPPSSAR